MVRNRRQEHGGVLLEFALVMGVLWMLVAGTIELGRMVAAGHLIQSAARSGARTLALAQVEEKFADAVGSVFDPDYLVVDVAACNALGIPLAELERDLPLVNRLLFPLMVREDRELDGEARSLLRYPGTLVRNPTPPDPDKDCVTGYTVAVAELRSVGGATIVCWHRVVEELVDGGTGESRFPLDCDGEVCGVAGLEVHYPFQSAAFPAWRDTGATLPDGRPVRRVSAWNEGAPGELIGDPNGGGGTQCDDLATAIATGATIGTLGDGRSLIDPYGGPLGLGRIHVLPEIASGPSRAYRKVLTGTALYPREGFM